MAKFEKGNPGGLGRVRGSRNKATLYAIAAGRSLNVLRAMADKAEGGDVAAAKVVLAGIWPVERGSFVKIDLPTVSDAASLADAQARLVAAAANEEISVEQAAALSTVLENRRRALETSEIESNLRQAEENLVERERADKGGKP